MRRRGSGMPVIRTVATDSGSNTIPSSSTGVARMAMIIWRMAARSLLTRTSWRRHAAACCGRYRPGELSENVAVGKTTYTAAHLAAKKDETRKKRLHAPRKERKMDRPYIVLQMCASIDGRITTAPNLTMFDRDPIADLLPDSGAIWKKLEQAIEDSCHPRAMIMGSGTVRREGEPVLALPPFEGNPEPLHEDFLPEEVLTRTTSWAVLVDGRGRNRGGYKATEEPGRHILHLVSHAASAEYLAFLRREQIPYLIGGQTHVDLPEAMRKLSCKLSVKAVRLWGGGTLNGAMLRADLIDEIHLIVWPLMIGGKATPTLADCPDLTSGDQPAKLKLVWAQPQADGYLWLHYKVDRAAAR